MFDDPAGPAHLAYRIACDARWASLRASVVGWVGARRIERRLQRDGAVWRVDGTTVASLDGLEDVDLGFTPASNTNALRRLRLGVGDEAVTTAAWLDGDDWCFKPLLQTYRRIAQDAYEYHSPTHRYRAILRVDDFGAVTEYPNLWAEAVDAV